MRKFKLALRILGLVLLIILASAGVGITGHFLPTHRERYQDKQNTIEQVDKKEDEGDSEKEQKN